MTQALQGLSEGFADQRSGMNSTRAPILLGETQYALGVNVAVRNGLATTRDALAAVAGDFPSTAFQGAGVWSLPDQDRLVFCAGGNVYTLGVDDGVLTDLGALVVEGAQCFFTQVDKYMVVQDGVFGDSSVEFVVSDGTNETTQTVDVTVISETPQPVTLDPVPSVSIPLGSRFDSIILNLGGGYPNTESIDVTATARGDALQSDGINVDGSGTSRTLVFNPYYMSEGVAYVEITATDGYTTATRHMRVSIVDAPAAPDTIAVATGDPALSWSTAGNSDRGSWAVVDREDPDQDGDRYEEDSTDSIPQGKFVRFVPPDGSYADQPGAFSATRLEATVQGPGKFNFSYRIDAGKVDIDVDKKKEAAVADRQVLDRDIRTQGFFGDPKFEFLYVVRQNGAVHSVTRVKNETTFWTNVTNLDIPDGDPCTIQLVLYGSWDFNYKVRVVRGSSATGLGTVALQGPGALTGFVDSGFLVGALSESDYSAAFDVDNDTYMEVPAESRDLGYRYVAFDNFSFVPDGSVPAPTINPVEDQVTSVGAALTNIPFEIEVEPTGVPLTGLTLSAYSTNQDVVTDANITITGGAGDAIRYLDVTPEPGITGRTEIVVLVNDNGANVVTESFFIDVGIADTIDPPEFTDIRWMSTPYNTALDPIAFTLSNNTVEYVDLTFTATSDNENLFPDANLVIDGEHVGAVGGEPIDVDVDGTLTVTPGTNVFGDGTIYLGVFNGQVYVERSFKVRVGASGGNTAPLVEPVPNLALVGGQTKIVPVYFSDADGDSLSLTVSRENETVFPSGAIIVSGSQVFLTPATVLENPPVLEVGPSGVPQTLANDSIPKGYQGIFAHGRYHLVPSRIPNTEEDGRTSIVSGDIREVGNSATALSFTETDYLSEGGAHGLPAELGRVGALGVLRNSGSGNGLGQVVAIAENGSAGFNFFQSRSTWSSTQISNIFFTGSGSLSPWGIANLNNDLMYRATDGIRSLRYTLSQTNSGTLSNVPMSVEVQDYMDADSSFLARISMAASDNRLYTTITGQAGNTYRALLVYDVAAAQYQGAQGPGVYEGLWTGANFLQVLSAKSNAKPVVFVFADGIKLYKVDPDAVFDATDSSIESKLVTRVFHFGDFVGRKHLRSVDMWVSDVPTDTIVKVLYRPRGYPLWFELGERTINVPAGSLPQNRAKLRFSLDYEDEFCDPVSGFKPFSATGFQFAIVWTGRMTIEGFRAEVIPTMEEPPDPCDAESVELLSAADGSTGDSLDEYSYVIGG